MMYDKLCWLKYETHYCIRGPYHSCYDLHFHFGERLIFIQRDVQALMR